MVEDGADQETTTIMELFDGSKQAFLVEDFDCETTEENVMGDLM